MLVVGLGPAGYTLAHYLLNEGFGVVGIDGLKIEPLPVRAGAAPTARRRSRSATGERSTGALDERMLAGFGGVSEYGITVRWDKNFLTLLHLTLARREQLPGLRRRPLRRHADRSTTRGRWASTTSPSPPAPGRPTLIDMKNNLIRGVRKATDFLMALQLTGAYKRDRWRTCRCGCRRWSSAAA